MQTGYKCYLCALMTQILCEWLKSLFELADVAFLFPGVNVSLIPYILNIVKGSDRLGEPGQLRD